jgi:hypothetical protein
MTHSIFKSVLGTDQSMFSPHVAVNGQATEDPPYLAVSDTYMDFVRSGMISVSRGKLNSLDKTTAVLSDNEQITDIAAVIYATGFEAASSISFLPSSVRDELATAPGDLNNTVALGFHGTHHPSVPNLGFVGFYRSPYWGIMEMQARVLATLWSPPVAESLTDVIASDTSVSRTMSLRANPSRLSQFPMGDYIYLMSSFSSALSLPIRSVPPVGPTLPSNGKHLDMLTPARYSSVNLSAEQEDEVKTALSQTYDTALAGLTTPKFVARAVFRSLLGEWHLDRALKSKLPSHPSGRFVGIAKFLLRNGTADGRPSTQTENDLGWEYLYIEQGEFRADNGFTFPASRRYVWRYDEENDQLSVWFAKTDDQKRADYLFHDVEFLHRPPLEDDGKGWQAQAGHLCIDDFYNVKYEFKFQAVNLKEWTVGYNVSGPKKDYTIAGVYTR